MVFSDRIVVKCRFVPRFHWLVNRPSCVTTEVRPYCSFQDRCHQDPALEKEKYGVSREMVTAMCRSVKRKRLVSRSIRPLVHPIIVRRERVFRILTPRLIAFQEGLTRRVEFRISWNRTRRSETGQPTRGGHSQELGGPSDAPRRSAFLVRGSRLPFRTLRAEPCDPRFEAAPRPTWTCVECAALDSSFPSVRRGCGVMSGDPKADRG